MVPNCISCKPKHEWYPLHWNQQRYHHRSDGRYEKKYPKKWIKKEKKIQDSKNKFEYVLIVSIVFHHMIWNDTRQGGGLQELKVHIDPREDSGRVITGQIQIMNLVGDEKRKWWILEDIDWADERYVTNNWRLQWSEQYYVDCEE